MDELFMAHPLIHRAMAKKALDKHGSLRKAARATGLSHSTIAYWKKQGWLEHIDPTILDQVDPEARVDVPDGVDDEGKLIDPLPSTDEDTTTVPTGFPETPEVAAQYKNGTMPTGPPNQQAQIPQGQWAAWFPGSGVQEWVPEDPRALQALWRYVTAVAGGSHPHDAHRAAQMIDPYFDLSPDQNARLLEGIASIMLRMDEGELQLFASKNPPPYVTSVYDQYQMGQEGTAQLQQGLQDLYLQGYRDAIDKRMSALGGNPIGSVTDPTIINRYNTMAEQQSKLIADTWNRDLASQVGSQWIDLSAQRGRQMSRAWLADSIQDWTSGRAGWKSEMWARSAYMTAFNQANLDFQLRNKTAKQGRIIPGDAECHLCQSLVDTYGKWTPLNQLDASAVPAHPQCVHSVEYDDRTSGMGSLRKLWSAQASGPATAGG